MKVLALFIVGMFFFIKGIEEYPKFGFYYAYILTSISTIISIFFHTNDRDILPSIFLVMVVVYEMMQYAYSKIEKDPQMDRYIFILLKVCTTSAIIYFLSSAY